MKCFPKSQNSCLERTDGVLLEVSPRQAAQALPGPAWAEQPRQWDGNMGGRAGGSGDKVSQSQWQDHGADALPCQPLGISHDEANALGMAEVPNTELLLQR